MDRLTFQIIYNYIIYLSKHNFEIGEVMLTVFGAKSKRIKKFLRFTSIEELRNFGEKYNLFLPIPIRVFGSSPYDDTVEYDGKTYINVINESDDFYFVEKICAKNPNFTTVDVVEYTAIYDRHNVRINQNKTYNRDLNYQFEGENWRFKMLFKIMYEIQSVIHDVLDDIEDGYTEIPATDIINMLNGENENKVKVIGDYYFARRNGIEYSTVEIGLCNQDDTSKYRHPINCPNAELEDTAYIVNMEELTYILKKIGS